MNKVLVGLLGFGIVLGAGAVYLQQQTNAQLREEVAALRADMQQMAKQREGARREDAKTAAGAVVRPENATADETRAAVAALREEVKVLKASTQEAAKLAQSAQQAARGESPVPVKLMPASEWKNAGKATVPAAVETLLWAAAGGDVETMAKSILLEPAAEAKAQALFAQLPDATRSEYGSPDKLVALLLAKDASAVSGMQVLGQRDLSPDVVGVRIRVADEQGQTKEQTFAFQKTGEGLQLKVPESVVDKYARQLAGAPGGK